MPNLVALIKRYKRKIQVQKFLSRSPYLVGRGGQNLVRLLQAHNLATVKI